MAKGSLMHIRNKEVLPYIQMNPEIKSQIERAFDRKDKPKKNKYNNRIVYMSTCCETPTIVKSHNDLKIYLCPVCNTYCKVIKFDSEHEYKGYKELRVLQQLKIVSEIKLQVPHKVFINGSWMFTYKSDFDVTFSDGHTEVWDYKGVKTPVYNLKKKLVKAILGIDIIEK